MLIDHLRGDQRAITLLKQLLHDGCELWSAVVVRTEVLAGMRPREEIATRELLDHLNWIEITTEIADRAGILAQQYLKSHPGVDTVDYLIAASAEMTGCRLITCNTRHFPMFPRMKPAYS